MIAQALLMTASELSIKFSKGSSALAKLETDSTAFILEYYTGDPENPHVIKDLPANTVNTLLHSYINLSYAEEEKGNGASAADLLIDYTLRILAFGSSRPGGTNAFSNDEALKVLEWKRDRYRGRGRNRSGEADAADAVSLASTILEIRRKDDVQLLKKESQAAQAALGAALHRAGNLTEAATHLEDLLGRRIEQQGFESILVLTTINNLAMVYSDARDYEKALPLLEKCLLLKRRTLGNANLSTLRSIANLAACLRSKGDTEGASHYLREVAAVLRAMVSQSGELSAAINGNAARSTLSQQLVQTLVNLSACLTDIGSRAFTNAAQLVAENVCITRELLLLARSHLASSPSSSSSFAVIARDNPAIGALGKGLAFHARALKAASKYEESEFYYLESLTLKIALHGDRSHEALLARNNLATLYKSMNRFDEAEQNFRTCLENQLKNAADLDPCKMERCTANIMNNLAMCLFQKLPSVAPSRMHYLYDVQDVRTSSSAKVDECSTFARVVDEIMALLFLGFKCAISGASSSVASGATTSSDKDGGDGSGSGISRGSLEQTLDFWNLRGNIGICLSRLSPRSGQLGLQLMNESFKRLGEEIGEEHPWMVKLASSMRNHENANANASSWDYDASILINRLQMDLDV